MTRHELTPELREALAEAAAVRFLCSGNVVRSAFAEVYARHIGCPLPVDSAATLFRNPAMFEPTREALLARGVPEQAIAGFFPRHVDDLDFERFPSRRSVPVERQLVLGMQRHHLEAWRQVRPDAPVAWLLGDLIGVGEIEDPVLDGADWDRTYAMLVRCVEVLVEELGSSA